MMADALVRLFDADASTLAKLRMAEMSVSAELWKRAHDSYPRSIEPLAAEAGQDSVDPFTGKPFLWKKTEAGYLMWSTGPDGKDDGAQPIHDTGDGKEGDLVWYGGGEEPPK
jgi:hypothetical protein